MAFLPSDLRPHIKLTHIQGRHWKPDIISHQGQENDSSGFPILRSMPKKRTYNFKQFQTPSSSSSSTAQSRATQNDTPPSVNEKLNELRKLETKEATARKRQIAESVNQRSVPLEIRAILGVPESAPPKPKANIRMRDRLRTPGPAPPKSWLSGGSTSSWKLKKNADKSGRSRPKQLMRFSRLTGLLSDDSIDSKPPTLAHLALKTIAESWDLLDEDDYPALTDIPLRLRLRLLSYIDFYGSVIDIAALRALLQSDQEIEHLDLAGLVGYSNLSLKKIGKLLAQNQGDEGNTTKTTVAESWDLEESAQPAFPSFVRETRFSNLTHLCLSHPAPSISWGHLIAFSKTIPHVTHLSLAYWPRPTLTPNLSTATISSQHSPDVTAGGSHYYSALDKDLAEPASLLRQLSSNLLCLRWLDLEGCEEWTPALEKLATYDPDGGRARMWVRGWMENSSEGPTPSIFASNWKNLEYIRCAQGWMPSLVGIQGMADRREATVIDKIVVDGVLKVLKREREGMNGEMPSFSQDVVDAEKKRARIWLQHESLMTFACSRLNAARRAQSLKAIEIDFGWIRRHSSTT